MAFRQHNSFDRNPRVNPVHTLALLTDAEPIAWLIVLLALYFCGERRVLRLQKHGLGDARYDEQPPSYRALGVFVALKLLLALAYPVLMNHVLTVGLSARASHIAYAAVFWALYLSSTIAVFFVIAALVRNSLTPLPGLSAAALAVFRWVAALLLLIALTAHMPIFGFGNVWRWLDEVNVSFAICVCSFEVTLLVLLLMRLERLGMCLRSRPVGLAFGLMIMGSMELFSTLTINFSTGLRAWVNVLYEVVILFTLFLWGLYIILPEPRRVAHSLAPASRLMRWNEIALKLEVSGKRQVEQTPFISGVQLIVDGILDKYKIGNH